MSYNTAKAGEARDYQSVTPTSELALNEALSRLPMDVNAINGLSFQRPTRPTQTAAS